MIYFLLTLIALAVAFLLWFLAALIRESRQLRTRGGTLHDPEADRLADVETDLYESWNNSRQEHGQNNREAHGTHGAGRAAVHASTTRAADFCRAFGPKSTLYAFDHGPASGFRPRHF